MFTSELLLPIAVMVKPIFPARIHKTQRLRVYVLCFIFFSCTEKKRKKERNNRDREIKHDSITNPLITLITPKRKTRPLSWYQRDE